MILVPTECTHSQNNLERRKKIAIFGSTGSVGTSTVEVASRFPELFEVVCLVGGRNRALLLDQISLLKPSVVVAALGQMQDVYTDDEFITEALKRNPTTEIRFGSEGVIEAAKFVDYDLMVASIVGVAGLPSVYEATIRGKHIALANKESMVCAGGILGVLASQTGAKFLPVDSEHSALWQALLGNSTDDINSLIVTASGGPFFQTPKSEFNSITKEQALKHPRWTMGTKITVDSSTLMNKCLELIEAYWLFGVKKEQIKVIVNPESIVHSIVEYKDGTQIFQCSVPDMKGAIGFAMSYPSIRLPTLMKPLDLVATKALHFYEVDRDKFPIINLAEAVMTGASGDGVVLNAADEIAVEQFLCDKIMWYQIPQVIERYFERFSGNPVNSIEDVLELNNKVKSTLL